MFICGNSVYEYNGWTFEYGMACGLWPVNKNGDPYKRAGKKFYDDVSSFFDLPENEQDKYQIIGGCERYELLR